MTHISDSLLINSFVVLSVAIGGMAAFAPQTAAIKYGFGVKAGTASSLFLQGSGYITLCSAVVLYLCSTGNVSLHTALGCGMLSRIFWLVKSIATGAFAEAGIKTDRIGLVTTVVSACTYVLLSGNGDVDVAARAIVALVGVSAALLFLNPVLASRAVFSKEFSKPGNDDTTVTKVVFRAFGKTNLVNISLMAAMTMGSSTAKALGCCNAIWALAELHDIVTRQYLDLGKGISTCIVSFSIAAITSSILLA
uniref:Uncharacterized protein n=1 Tax=Odontella aurita TaxID=265563 RepID=A0A7S4JLD1_9STRA|mmetsp:Transcript_48614/g.146594  ORF Transcript_48614/g.146594 Transcript_48614/m.146594 type:complete len:251 (+) Transcript_48614:162-914(+)